MVSSGNCFLKDILSEKLTKMHICIKNCLSLRRTCVKFLLLLLSNLSVCISSFFNICLLFLRIFFQNYFLIVILLFMLYSEVIGLNHLSHYHIFVKHIGPTRVITDNTLFNRCWSHLGEASCPIGDVHVISQFWFW